MRPTFIACTARSGSTLLRWLIDSHPDVVCPAETDLALAVGSLERSAMAMAGPDDRGAIVGARRAAETLIEDHLTRAGAHHFVDKSMSNALNLDLLARAWLSARFIFLHRHVMDFVASAFQAQPFGLTDYGFAAYAARSPGDDVGALVRYWLERTSRMLTFESSTGHKSVRLRYEDLATGAAAAMSEVWKLVGAEPHDGDAFGADHGAHGCGDHQIWYTNHVSSESIGWGARVAPQRVAGALRLEVNAALADLGYPLIDDNWGAGGPLIETDQVRIVSGHQVIRRAPFTCGGTIAVEADAVDALIFGRVNVGAALRSREIRYYGPPLSGYGAERDVMSRLPSVLGELF